MVINSQKSNIRQLCDYITMAKSMTWWTSTMGPRTEHTTLVSGKSEKIALNRRRKKSYKNELQSMVCYRKVATLSRQTKGHSSENSNWSQKKLKRSRSTTKSVGYEARGRLPQMGFLIHYQQRRKLQQNATIHKGLLC